MERPGKVREPIMTLILTILTCWIYYLYWMIVTCEDINKGLGEKRFNWVVEFVLGFLTCGVWFLVWEWRSAEAIVEIEQRWGLQPQMEPVLLFITNFFGLGPLFYQRSMNHAWQQGQPPSAGMPDRLEQEIDGLSGDYSQSPHQYQPQQQQRPPQQGPTDGHVDPQGDSEPW